ncbi:MAG TPA: hypothetical protein VKV17_13325 [Bryobacteraceae bacterium]|nr:hypothetical protein [Bryobacteraceae bacterium]
MWYRLVATAFVAALAAQAQSLTVKQLFSFIQSSVQMKQSDKEVASYLSKAKMSEKLDGRTVEELQALGIGPKTLAAVRRLSEESQSLAEAAPVVEVKVVPKPPPSSEEQAQIIGEVREYALNYSKTLPDYICTLVVRRYVAPYPGGKYGGRRGDDPSWQLANTLTVRLSYYDQKEDYKLILINNSPTQMDYNKVGGSRSTGDFGTMLREVFEPATEAHFEWDHWGLLRGRHTYVFAYHVAQERSQWHVTSDQEDTIAAYKGLIYVDQETKQVLRISLEAVDLPPTFPVKQASDTLDYDYQDVGGQQFLLPLKNKVIINGAQFLTRNDNEYHLYHKYSAESAVQFDVTDTPAPLPDDKGTEAPKK